MMNERVQLAGLERRREDYRLITGLSHYVDDLRPPPGRPPALHMVVVRSPYAHAEIKNIRLDAARSLQGVLGAFEGAELVSGMPTLDTIPVPGLKKPERRPMAVGIVRYVGDPVAVIVAESFYIAVDARDLVEVEYELLPTVSDPEAAIEADAGDRKGPLPTSTSPPPLLYEELGSNIAFLQESGGGDIQAAFESADRVVRLRVVNQRLAPGSLEPRACMFDFDPTRGELSAWVSSQAIYRARDTLANFLGLDRRRIRVYNAEVGGAFGAKSNFLGEEIVAALLAVKYGRPIKWIEGRSENLQAQTQGRGQINYIEAAFQNDGRLLGLRVRSIADLGAFLTYATAMVPCRTPSMLCGPYQLQALESQVMGVFTNKVATAPYRGAGRPEATYILERTMDRIAHELNLDPAEVRRRNFIPPQAFPYQTVTGLVYDSGNYQAALDRTLALADYSGWRAKQRENREAEVGAINRPGEIMNFNKLSGIWDHPPRADKSAVGAINRPGTINRPLLGIGLSSFIEFSGDNAAPRNDAPREAATVSIRRDGSVLVQSGISHNGQGHYTALAQIAATILNLPASKVEVRMNDTGLPAFSIGTYGSRITQVAGSAVLLAAQSVRTKALQVAAQLLEAAPADLVMEEGRVMVRGVPARMIELGELARLVEESPDLVEQEHPDRTNSVSVEGLAAWRDFSPPGAAYASGTHLAVVEVDTDTGEVHVLKFVAVDDCGRVLNHYLAEAQIHGSLAQGISQALYEEVLYDRDGQLLSGTLLDYSLPVAGQVPDFDTAFIETPSPYNPLGAKGVGESGCIGAPPAIVNAVLDALSPLGIETIDMPLKPEKIWTLVQAASS